jgi:hypothetical protein
MRIEEGREKKIEEGSKRRNFVLRVEFLFLLKKIELISLIRL